MELYCSDEGLKDQAEVTAKYFNSPDGADIDFVFNPSFRHISAEVMFQTRILALSQDKKFYEDLLTLCEIDPKHPSPTDRDLINKNVVIVENWLNEYFFGADPELKVGANLQGSIAREAFAFLREQQVYSEKEGINLDTQKLVR